MERQKRLIFLWSSLNLPITDVLAGWFIPLRALNTSSLHPIHQSVLTIRNDHWLIRSGVQSDLCFRRDAANFRALCVVINWLIPGSQVDGAGVNMETARE